MSQALDRKITNLHLQGETIYRRVTEKEFIVQCKRLNHVWMYMGKSVGLDERLVSRLKLDKPTCPVFYSLIKTHKPKRDETNSTSAATFKIRPIIICVGEPTDRISWFLNKITCVGPSGVVKKELTPLEQKVATTTNVASKGVAVKKSISDPIVTPVSDEFPTEDSKEWIAPKEVIAREQRFFVRRDNCLDGDQHKGDERIISDPLVSPCTDEYPTPTDADKEAMQKVDVKLTGDVKPTQLVSAPLENFKNGCPKVGGYFDPPTTTPTPDRDETTKSQLTRSDFQSVSEVGPSAAQQIQSKTRPTEASPAQKKKTSKKHRGKEHGRKDKKKKSMLEAFTKVLRPRTNKRAKSKDFPVTN
ncbi:hypothetical protein RB195_013888 [Necator americanus]|uniref:Uncharacterized protein n=1 Tax=Necator americanus TaxID=51031 RepID=A0ABR1DXN9_NECAM